MLLSKLLPMFETSPLNIAVPKWTQFVDDCLLRLTILNDRRLRAVPINNELTRMFSLILGMTDMLYMNKPIKDTDRYLNYLRFEKVKFDRVLNSNLTGNIAHNLIIKNSYSSIPVFLIPTSESSYMSSLPMDEGWDSWKKVKPIRVCGHDSVEMPEIDSDMIEFKYEEPTFMVIAVDTIALAFKWFYYTTSNVEDEFNSVIEFTHRHVFDTLSEDLFHIWCNKQLRLMRTVSDLDEKVDIVARVGNNQSAKSGVSGAQYKTAATALYKQFLNNTTFKDSLKYVMSDLVGGTSLLNLSQSLVDSNHLIDTRENIAFLYLRDIEYFKTIFAICNVDPNNTTLKRYKARLRRTIKKLNNQRVWQSVKNKTLADLLEMELTLLLLELD